MLDPSEKPLVALGAAATGAAALVWLASRRSATTSASPHATGFEAYLRDASVGHPAASQQQFAATSFEAYLRQPPAAAAAAAAGATGAAQATTAGSGASAAAGAAPTAPADALPITILFGTEFGFSKEVAEKACERLRAAPAPAPTSQDGGGGGSKAYWPTLLDMADLPQGLPSLGAGQHQALLVVCSTQGDGVPPSEAREFCDWLAGAEAPRLGGAPVFFSVCALGDKSYQHFCRCGRTLDARLEGLGAARLAPRVDVNKEDWAAIDGWMDGVLAGLAQLPLKSVAELGGVAAAEGAGPDAPEKRWSKNRPFMGRVVALEPLCTLASADDKDTARVEVDLGDSRLQYTPGDALGVWPSNCPQAVSELLCALRADGSLLVQVPGWHYVDPLLPAGATSLPLRDALQRCYDLRQPKPELLRLLHARLAAAANRVSLRGDGKAGGGRVGGWREEERADGGGKAGNGGGGGGKNEQGKNGRGKNGQVRNGKAASWLVQHTRGADSASELIIGGGPPPPPPVAVVVAAGHDVMCADGCIMDKLERLAALVADPAAADAYLAPRHVIDVLHDFAPPPLAALSHAAPAAPLLGPAELLGTLRQLQPRLYSISSSQLEHPTRVQATVAVVRYRSLDADRLGVCSTFLAERLAEGRQLPVYIHKNPDFRLPADDATPIIMVGPGTGLAPFRSFMQERILRAQQNGRALGPCVLYFGCRRRDQDYLYGPLLEGWAAEGKLQLHTAFSREQAHKVYVQDRLTQSGAAVWDLLDRQGAHFYVCGDAGSMAGAVEAALLEIIRQGQGAGPEEARAYLARLGAAGRYQRDVWLS